MDNDQILKKFVWDNPQWANLLVMDSLGKLESRLDLKHADGQVLRLCTEDFWNYLRFLREQSTGINHRKNDEDNVFFSIIGEMNNLSGDTKILEKIQEFIVTWVKLWFAKYQERVRIVLEKPRPEPFFMLGQAAMNSKFNPMERNDILKMATITLIRYGEIACSQTLANYLFRKVLGVLVHREKDQDKIKSLQFKLDFTSVLLRNCEQVSRMHGAIIFIRPDRRYYEMRERFDEKGTAS